MAEVKTPRIFDDKYVELLRGVVEHIVLYDDVARALELSKFLEKETNNNISGLKSQPHLAGFYKEEILKLKFVCLPLLDDKEIYSLVKNNFCFQAKLADYDFLSKLETYLVGTYDLDYRDKIKRDLKRALTENIERLTPNHEIKSVGDWVRNYISQTGLEKKDDLIKAQYLIKLKDNKAISREEYSDLNLLFKIYDKVDASSLTPEGFEEEPPVEKDGQLYIFRKGALDPVPSNQELKKAVQEFSGQASNTAPTITKPADNVSQPVKSDNLLAPEVKTPLSPTAELEQSLKNYSSSSLEYKAIKQEITRLNKSSAKKPNVQK